VGALGDPYAAYYPPDAFAELTASAAGRYTGIGVEVEPGPDGMPVVVQVFPGSPAASAPYAGAPPGAPRGLQAGDRLVAVDGRPVRGLPLAEVAARIVGPSGTRVRVEVARGARLLTFTLVRRPVVIVTVTWRMLPGGIGYLGVHAFNQETPAEVGAALARLRGQGMRALVLDLRDNPGGVLDAAVATARYFLPPGVVVVLRGRAGSQAYVLRSTEPVRVPMAVLVNRFTASAAEVLAGAIQDDGVAPLVGQRTFGKGVVQRVFPLAAGGGLRLTVARYETPKGRDLNGRGLTPDVAAPPPATAAAYGDPRTDPQLAAALALLRGALARRAA